MGGGKSPWWQVFSIWMWTNLPPWYFRFQHRPLGSSAEHYNGTTPGVRGAPQPARRLRPVAVPYQAALCAAAIREEGFSSGEGTEVMGWTYGRNQCPARRRFRGPLGGVKGPDSVRAWPKLSSGYRRFSVGPSFCSSSSQQLTWWLAASCCYSGPAWLSSKVHVGPPLIRPCQCQTGWPGLGS